MTSPQTHASLVAHPLRLPVLWGLAFGAAQAALPLAFRWLDPATVHALSIVFIAAVYIGFAVGDGRPKVIAVETVVAGGLRCDRGDRCDGDGLAAGAAAMPVTGSRTSGRSAATRTRRRDGAAGLCDDRWLGAAVLVAEMLPPASTFYH